MKGVLENMKTEDNNCEGICLVLLFWSFLSKTLQLRVLYTLGPVMMFKRSSVQPPWWWNTEDIYTVYLSKLKNYP